MDFPPYPPSLAPGSLAFSARHAGLMQAIDAGVGLKGDGVSNDGAAITNLFNFAATSGRGIYFPGNRTYECGSVGLVDPGSIFVICGPGALFRRSADPAGGYSDHTASFLNLGSYSRWSGGTFTNTAVYATSTTSITVTNPSPGSYTFTTQLNLAFLTTPGFNFVRVWSASNPAIGFEGTVTAYNPATGSITVSAPFALIVGTKTDWNITIGNVYQSPVVLHNVTEAVFADARITGNWYEGPTMEAWNPPGGGSLLTSYCTFRGLQSENVQNRGIYCYGSGLGNLITDCTVQGGGLLNYGININPANATGTVNAQTNLKITDCEVVNVLDQGIGIGDQCFEVSVSGIRVDVMVRGYGILDSAANQGLPSHNRYDNNVILSALQYAMYSVGTAFTSINGLIGTGCGGGLGINSISTPGGLRTPQYVKATNIAIQNSLVNSIPGGGSTTGDGIDVLGNAVDCDIDCQCVSNAGTGVLIGSGSTNTTVSGRSVANTVAQLTDSGTGSVTAQLRQV